VTIDGRLHHQEENEVACYQAHAQPAAALSPQTAADADAAVIRQYSPDDVSQDKHPAHDRGEPISFSVNDG